jgi:hypothetical protein
VSSNNGMDETAPSRRARPKRGASKRADRAGPMAVSAGVWMLGSLLVVLALALCGLWGLYLLHGRAAAGRPSPALIIWTPTAAPMLAIDSSATPGAGAEPEAGTRLAPTVAVGDYVQVTGTGGYGLSLRSGPGENYTRMDVAMEGEVFIVVDGPAVGGGSEWWKIRDHEDEAREWWAVASFLEPVAHP